MSKYISKDDAVLAIAQHEMYEAETEYPYASDDIEDWKEVGERMLANVQDADVVEVVRCKDCKHRRGDGFCKKYQRNIDGSATMWFAPDDDWYCADGEKVTE